MKVLIVDEGRDRASVAAARALAATGWTVGVGCAAPDAPRASLAARSSATAALHQIVHTDDGEEAFARSVEQVVREHGYDTVFPGWESAVVALSERRERLGCPLGYGRHDGILTAIDKWSLVPVAQAAGLEVPRTVIATREGLAQLGRRVVVKPASQREVRLAAAAFESPDGALARAQQIETLGGRAIAQERLDGRLAAVSFVAGPDGIVSIAQQIAEHAWPRPVGVTARGRSVRVDPQLRAAIEQLLDALGWQGLAQLQFIVPADGRPRLIDFNPRLYGSLPLAIRAGANLPDAWARMTTGLPVAYSEGRPGARYQWFSRDLRASLVDPGRVRETVECLMISRTASHALWSREEPGLAPRFLLEQAGRKVRDRLTRPTPEEVSSARLHGADPTPAVRRALRSRRIPPWPERVRQRIAMKRGRLAYEDDWLRPLQAARRSAVGPAADGPPRFLVRVDEFPHASGYDDPRFGFEASARFHSVLAEAGVEYLLAVVPQWTGEYLRPDGKGERPLDDRDRELIARMRSEGVTFGQHGATHRTRFANPRRHSELSGLDDAALAALLDDGRRRLEASGITPRVLVPPFNRFDAGQWNVLSERYDVITGGPESVLTMGFQGGPVWRGEAVYLPCYEPLYASADVVAAAAERLIERQVGTWVPLVLHVGWEVEDGYAALARLARRIAPYSASWDGFLDAVDASRNV